MAKKYLTDEELEKLLYESDSDCVLSENEDVDYSSGEDEILVLGEQSTSSSEEQNISIAEVQDSENDVYQPGPSKRMRINNRKSLPGGIPWKFDNNFTPKDFGFDRSHSGITDNLKLQVDSPELVYFRHFLNKELVGGITEETNRYAETMKNKNMPSFSKWVNVNISEMYTFTALCILMGFIEKPALKDYWSTNPVIETPFFAKVCSRDRFLQILYALHFADNANLDKNDALRKIRPILSSLKESFGRSLYPFEDLAIDESLILWKGRLAFKQYIPSKRHRFGVKLFEICDAETGYILDLIIYTGASTNIQRNEEFGISENIVLTLMEPYLNKGHTLYVDNWYTSPALFHYLHDNNTGACGTVRSNRRGMPDFGPVGKGDCEIAHNDKILALKWYDKRVVHMLTSVGTANMTETGKTDFKTGDKIMKPACIIQYNSKMGAIDKVDMQVSFVECARKTLKWYKKVYFHMIDLCLYNSYILYQIKTGRKPSFSSFRLQIVTQMIGEFHTLTTRRAKPPTVDNPLRLIERHFPAPIPQTEAQGKKTQRRCHVCANTNLAKRKRKDVKFMCKECSVALCVYPCFEQFHTKKKY